nr:hypothetical protein [Sphingomonas sp. Y57]
MTAINAFLTPGGAHLLTDAAFYDTEGRLRHVASKIAVCEPLRMAIAVSGMAEAARVVDWYAAYQDLSQSYALTLLPMVARAIRDDNLRAGFPGEPDVQLVAALWSDEHDQPQLWIASSNRAWFGERYQPGTLARVGAMSGGCIDPLSVVPPHRRADGFDAIRDGLALLRAQRAEPWPDNGRYYVGGFAERTTVTRGGIERMVLERWPDRLGELITPAENGQS